MNSYGEDTARSDDNTMGSEPERNFKLGGGEC